MSEGREYLDNLEDILDAAEKARKFVGEMDYESFAGDDKTAFAVVRGLELSASRPRECRKKSVIAIRKYRGAPWQGCGTS